LTDKIPFYPDSVLARRLDTRMRERLAGSLSYITSQMADSLPVSPEKLGGFLQRLTRAPVSSQLFGAYFDLVIAIETGEPEAAAILEEILATQAAPEKLQILNLGDPSSQAMAARYLRLINTDPSMQLALRSPPPELEAAARARLQAAFLLLEQGFPVLAEELSALIREIVLAVNTESTGPQFDGASSFMLWGAIILNAEKGDLPIALVEALAHESGHNLLFGLCADGPLVENDDLGLFPSPLRADLRPMDGIVHAAYVVARMHQAVQTVLNAGILDQAQAQFARASLLANAEAFRRGMETIDAHGNLTPLGHSLMQGARAYMSTAG
jgi:HEXXH motif-containing protein